MTKGFVESLKEIMTEELEYSDDKARELIEKYPDIVAHGFLEKPPALRATVLALAMKEVQCPCKGTGLIPCPDGEAICRDHYGG